MQSFAVRWLPASAFLFLAATASLVHSPGYVSYDAIVQWYDGRYGFTSGYPGHPPLMSLIWGVLEYVTPGPLPIFLLQMALFTAALWLAVRPARLVPVFGLMAAMFVLFEPYIFANLARINKDVLGGGAVLLAFSLVLTSETPGKRRAVWAGGALLAVAAFLRYQFAATVPFWLWIVFRTGGLGQASRGAMGLAAAAGCILVWLAASVNAPSDIKASFSKIIAFDLAGIAARVPAEDYAALAAPGVDPAELVRRMRDQYSTAKVDTLWMDGDRSAMELFNKLTLPQTGPAWMAAVTSHPGAFLAHRAATFGRVLGMGGMNDCATISRNPTAPDPPELAAILHTDDLPRPYTLQILRWRIFPAETVLFRPWLYVALALAGFGATLFWRRQAAASIWVRGALLAGLAYIATFLVLPQACDGRYAFLSVAITLIAGIVLLTPALNQLAERVFAIKSPAATE